MKRFVPLLIVLLLLPCLIVPASATTQGVIDAIEDTLIFGDDKTAAEILYNIWLKARDIDNSIWDTHDELGEWLGVTLGDIRDLLTDTVDRLDWLDNSVRGLETQLEEILNNLYVSAEYTIGTAVDRLRVYTYQMNNAVQSLGAQLADIITKLYVSADYTIGTAVDRIRTYTFQINEKVATIVNDLYVSAEYTVGTAIDRIRTYTYQINEKFTTLLKGDTDRAEDILEDSPPLQTEIDDYEDILATAPSIDADSFDNAITDVAGRFDGMNANSNDNALFSSLAQITGMLPLSSIIPTSAMLAVLSFALFGRTF